MDFDADSIGDSLAENLGGGPTEVARDLLPTKYLLLLPALAGAGFYKLLASLGTTTLAKLMSGADFELCLFLFAQILFMIPPLLARRKGRGRFLGYPFRTGMVLWTGAYAIGFSFVPCWPFLIRFV